MQLEISLDKVEIAAEQLRDCENKLQFLWKKMSEELERLQNMREEELFYVLREYRKEREKLQQEIEKLQRLREILEQIVKHYQRTEEKIQDFEEVPFWQPEYYLLHQLEQVGTQLEEWGIHIV